MRSLRLLVSTVVLLLAAWVILPAQTRVDVAQFINGSGVARGSIQFATDATSTIGNGAGTLTRPASVFLGSPVVTVGSGTGVTVDNAGEVRHQVYKVSVTYLNATTNGVTHDLTIATLPAKTFLVHALAAVTTPYVCAQTCTTSTLSGLLGSSAGGNQYLVSFDVDAASAQFGDTAAELGASLTPASVPTVIGALGSWTTTTTVIYRLTSGTGALATAGVTNLNAGAVTWYLTTVVAP